MVLTAIGLLAALSLTAPAPSQAVGLWESGIPLADTFEKAWSWLSGHLLSGTPQTRQAPWRKEGGAIKLNGGADPDSLDEGGAISPNGHH
jgi:hypothetical protein